MKLHSEKCKWNSAGLESNRRKLVFYSRFRIKAKRFQIPKNIRISCQKVISKSSQTSSKENYYKKTVGFINVIAFK